MPIEITPIPAFSDNYFWLAVDHETRAGFIVDPGDANPVIETLAKSGVRLTAIVITHHHPDHIGGVRGLLERFPVPVYGPASKHIPQVTHPVGERDCINLLEHRFQVLAVPGHTLDHIAYFSDETSPPTLFSGDTLFAGGCGRMFEGTAAQMVSSLDKLAALPDDTLVYCAHEYTAANLRFAQAVEPDNEALKTRIDHVSSLRQAKRPTVPSRLKEELNTNPFLRCRTPTVRIAAKTRGAKGEEPTAVFATIRQWKDNF
ncbi:MAG: hydroxyacylglutathione hydrolase [Porticoccaceae bacterium]|nr:hydroxyacylglutathione hydrolase [Porticoccaceae bacterium]